MSSFVLRSQTCLMLECSAFNSKLSSHTLYSAFGQQIWHYPRCLLFLLLFNCGARAKIGVALCVAWSQIARHAHICIIFPPYASELYDFIQLKRHDKYWKHDDELLLVFTIKGCFPSCLRILSEKPGVKLIKT